jgi:hypothetical protein
MEVSRNKLRKNSHVTPLRIPGRHDGPLSGNYAGKQPGDPLKAGEALLHITSLAEPPLRLLLGSDAYNAAENHALQVLASDSGWKDLSLSTDYRT